jgi:hypothetical protein
MIKKIYKLYEQAILFNLLIIYLIGFMFYFENEMRTIDWMMIIYLIQFFGLGTILFLYGKQKGWKWPQR